MLESSDMVKGMSIALSLVQILDEERKALGISDEEFHNLVKPEGRVLIRNFVEMMAEKSSKVKHNVLVIDCANSFNPTSFIGKGWKIEEQDERSLLMTQIDFSKVFFETCLKEGETWITGEEKYNRHHEAKHILADARIALVLLEEKGQKTLEYLYKEKGITCFELLGTILRSPGDDRCALYLYRSDGRWRWDYDWLGRGRDAYCPSLVLAS